MTQINKAKKGKTDLSQNLLEGEKLNEKIEPNAEQADKGNDMKKQLLGQGE